MLTQSIVYVGDTKPKMKLNRGWKTVRRLSGPMLTVSSKMNNIPRCLPIRPGTSRTSSKRSLPSIGLYPKSRRMCKHVRKRATKGSTVSRISFFFFFFSLQSFHSHRSKIYFSFSIHEKLDRGRDENRFTPEHALVVLFYGDKSLLTPIGKRFFDRALSVSRGENVIESCVD